MKQPLNNTGWGKDCSLDAGTGYNPSTTYFGMFDSTGFYEYDKTIPVDASPYNGSTGAPYDVTDGSGNILIDTSVTGAFVEASCTAGPGVNCWNGNFLNWLVTRKIDAARKVLVGGKLENRQGYDYFGDGSTTWKIVGNNERDDRSICKASSSGQTYSPFPDDTKFHLYSPADQGSVKSFYDPYAKLLPFVSGASSATVIKDKNDTVVGEFGKISSLDHNQRTITRIQSVTSGQFQIALHKEEGSSDHAAETVHYIAVEKGRFTSGDLNFSAGLQTDFDSSWKTLTFDSINATGFVADMQTTSGTDPATLRYRNLSGGTVDILVEEEEAADTETSHTDEDIGYLAIDASLGFNVALVVDEEPQGLVHEIEDKVRTGISFYRYQRDNDLYTGEWAHGGTLHLPIPSNPFVKSDSDIDSYRFLDTPIKSSTEDIVDAIEHYPLVWGTTPLAENLYEVGRYFSQDTPYYDDKPDINGESAYQVNDTWDPYTYLIEGSYQKVRCAKSFVILFTDGEPWRDDYVPTSIVGNSGGSGDYDEDNNAKDCSDTSNTTTNNCVDNLDDVARYLYWDTSTGMNRDLRTSDLDGEQHLEVFTVAFGSSTIPQILQDTADNANGEAYAAEDGEKLREALTTAITSILKRTSAGSSLSVLSERTTTGALINQALFFPQKTFTDGGKTFDVSWTGALNAYWFYNSRTVSNIRENTFDPLGFYTLDIHDDKVLDFRIDNQGALKIDYYTTIQDGSDDDGAADPNSGPGGTAGPEGTYQSVDEVNKIFEVGEI